MPVRMPLAAASSATQASPDTETVHVRERCCSVGRVVAVLSDSWTFLVLREMYLGARRFEQIRMVLQLPRTTLSARLNRLVQSGIILRKPALERPLRCEYRLSPSGLDLYRVMLALLRFGDDYLCEDRPPPLRLIHTACGHSCRPLSVCSSCGAPLDVAHVSYRDGPGAGTEIVETGRGRRRSDAAQFERCRPSSVSRALGIIGDRWSFLVLREAFFGVRRFDDLQSRLDIASNILSDRLARLVEEAVFSRVRYQDLPPRYEYRLTKRGRALYLPLIEMLRWGDRWFGDGRPPLVLTHRICGQDMLPSLVCDHCRMPIDAAGMAYQLGYKPPAGSASPAAAKAVRVCL